MYTARLKPIKSPSKNLCRPKMVKYLALQLTLSSVLLFLPALHSTDGSADGGDHEKDKYREPPDWVKYKRLIDDSLAEEDNNGCNAEGISCYVDVIDNDLKPYEHGVAYEKFKEGLDGRSQTRATHYQIIDHK